MDGASTRVSDGDDDESSTNIRIHADGRSPETQ